MNKTVIGIDPGKSGGIAVYSGGDTIHAEPCPSEIPEMAALIRRAVHNCEIEGVIANNIKVAIENVHAFPTDGRSSVFKFGTNFGIWLGICASNKLEVDRIQPRVWMKKYGELPKEKQERKRYLKVLASSYFQDARVTLKTADAILIAKYKFEESRQV